MKNNFRCSLNTPVYTNRQVLELGNPITIVIHDKDDGSWKFFSREEAGHSGEKAIIVSLSDILMIDPSLGEIAHLPEGGIATRKSAGGNWTLFSGKSEKKNNQIVSETEKS